MDSSTPDTRTPETPAGSALRKKLDRLHELENSGFLILHHWGKGPKSGNIEYRIEVPGGGDAPYWGLSGPQLDNFLSGARAAYLKLGAELPAGL